MGSWWLGMLEGGSGGVSLMLGKVVSRRKYINNYGTYCVVSSKKYNNKSGAYHVLLYS